MSKTRFFVVDKPGHYGDQTRVISAHVTEPAAKRAAGKCFAACVRRGSLVKGDVFRRAAETVYPIA